MGLLWTNSFACASGGGQALFPVFSLISHSCISNCTHSVFPNKHLALQSRMKIKKGQELTINYISSTQVSSILPMDYISIDDFVDIILDQNCKKSIMTFSGKAKKAKETE